MRILLHGGITHTQTAPEAQLPQKASTTLGNVLHHPALEERWTQRWTRSRDSQSALTLESVPRPSDPAWGCVTLLDDCTWSWNYAQMSFFLSLSLRNIVLTSISVWKLNKSIFCQLLPSRAKTFHAWEQDRRLRVTQEAWTYLYRIKNNFSFSV